VTRDTHYDFEILAELAEGLLDVDTAAQVREHLAVCDPCGETLADLAAVREMLAAVPVPAMPMGVALRIDKALSIEAETRRDGGVKLDEAPDWDRIMGDSPWETAPVVPLAASAPPAPEPRESVSLGVVADDGSIVPARRGKASRRRSWAMPAAASAAAAVVIGVAGLSTTLFSATGTGGPSEGSLALPAQTGVVQQKSPVQPGSAKPGSTRPGRSYVIGKSGFNYSNTVLNEPLVTVVGATGPGAGGDASVDPAVVRCVNEISDRVGRKLGSRATPKPIGVDQAFYEGNEATVMAFWKDRFRNAVWVYVVDSKCANMRTPAVGRWQ
jgi:hypothetical protein